MFVVRNYSHSFFAPAFGDKGFRFDPGCMSACDTRAEEVVTFFEEALSESEEVFWDGEDQVLVIDNHRALHARAAVTDADAERMLMRIAVQLKPLSR